MSLSYSGDRGQWPVYRCRADTGLCEKQFYQEVLAPAVEAEIVHLFLAALAPDQLALTVNRR